MTNTGATGGTHDANGMSIRGFIAFLAEEALRGTPDSEDPLSELTVGTDAVTFQAGSFFSDKDMAPYRDSAANTAFAKT